MVKRETIVAGSIISRRIYSSYERTLGEKRKKKSRPTAESVAAYNRRVSERDLMIKLHHNFKPGDLHVVLSYAGKEPTAEEAKREVDNFLRRLRRYFKKRDTELKWILATECGEKRIHHHLVVSQMDTYDLDKLWTAGKAYPSHLDNSGDYRKLASYMIKQSDETFRTPEAFSRQRFSCSRTIKNPPAKVEEVNPSQLDKDPKPIKGYYIDPNSIYIGVNPVTGIRYKEYIMVSLDPVPRLSIYPRGKRKKYKEKYYDAKKYPPEEYQLEFIMPWEEEI